MPMPQDQPPGVQFLAVVALAASLSAQSWQLASPATVPPARAGEVMATDLASGHVVMFGGYVGASYLGDAWSFDGANWSQLIGTQPPARMRAAMAYDENRATFVLYGGVNGFSTTSYLAGTWELANGTWSQRPSTLFPPRRFGHAMAYDAVRQRVVMFGGRTNAGTIFLQDTWEWDGTDWQYFTPAHAPSNRMGHSMAFDPNLGQVVLFGGLQLGGPFRNDTWTWNGTDWTELTPAAAPSPRGDQAMATDRARGRVVMFGGYDGADLTDTWEWNGGTWQAVAPAVQPGVLGLSAMATGPTGYHVVMFGGDVAGVVVAPTWRYGDLASVHAFGTGCGAPPMTLSPAPGSQPVLGQTFDSVITNVPAGGLPFLALGASATSAGGVPLPVDLSPLGMTGCWLYQDLVVLGFWCTPAGADWTNSLPLQNDASYVDVEIFAQAYALAPGSNPFGLLTSNALALYMALP